MGNRAVITTKENFKNNGIGLYLHWNGGRDSVEAFLKYCELKQYPADNCYQWARLAQVIGNFFGGTNSIGLGVVNELDCHNFDNGVYIIDDNWQIVDRRYHDGREQYHYDLYEMLEEIDLRMPKQEQIKDFIFGDVLESWDDIKIGDEIAYISDGCIKKVVIKDFGTEGTVNGHQVKGLPITFEYNNNLDNINNYLYRNITEYRKVNPERIKEINTEEVEL